MCTNIIVGETIKEPIGVPGLGCFLFNCLQEHAKNNLIAQVDAVSGDIDTFESLLKRSVKTALYLRKIGIQENDVVCLFGPNHLNTCVPFLASFFIGAIPSSLETLLPYEDLKHLINLIEPKIFFVTPEKVDLIQNILKDINKEARFVIFGKYDTLPSFSEILLKFEYDNTFKPIEIQNLKETAVLYFSSGTTGKPKAVCLNHYSILTFAHYQQDNSNIDTDVVKWSISKISGQYTVLTYKHLSWISAGMLLIRCIQKGSKTIIAEDFDPLQVWKTIEKYNVNCLNLLVSHLMELCKYGIPNGVDVSSLLLVICAGMAAPTELLLNARKLLPTAFVFQIYGQTEVCGAAVQINTNDKWHRKVVTEKPTAVGFPIPYISYKVVNPETNEILGPNQRGELRFKSEAIMNGYYKIDSKPYFDEDGYFKSGDVGYYDDDKCFFVVDRIKDIFKVGDIHVSPTEIEEVIYKHPAVQAAAVVGIPGDNGDDAVAAVVLKKDIQIEAKEIKEFVDSQVDDTKKLRGGVIFLDSLPFNATGKIQVMKLRSIIIKKISENV